MPETTPSSRPASFLTGAVFVLAVVLLGAFVGAFIARFFMSPGGMGWDEIANALGGVMVGGGAGLVLGLVTVRKLSPIARLGTAALSIVAAVGLVVYANSMPRPTRTYSVAFIPEPAVAPFSLTLGTSDPIEGPPRQPADLPWRTLRIYSNLSYHYVMAAKPNEICVAAGALNSPDGIAELKTLRANLAAQPAAVDCGPPCPTCTDVTLGLVLDQSQTSLSLTDRCWQRPEFNPIRASIAKIVSMGRSQIVCERTGG